MAEIHSDFKSIYSSKKRYHLVTGGRASLKSTSVHDFVARLMRQKGHGILFTRYTMKSAEISIIPEFRSTLIKLGWEKKFVITKNMIRNKKNGSFIIFSGIKTSSGDQTANLKSLPGITTWIIEEGEDFRDEEAFDRIDDSFRTAAMQIRIIWIMNSADSEHFIYKRWIEKTHKKIKIEGHEITVSTDPDVNAVHTTYHIALKYLSEGWLKKKDRIKEENSKAYVHTYLGGWLEQREGVIYENWRTGTFDYSYPWCFAQDYGFFPHPYALIRVAVDKTNMRVFIEKVAYGTKFSTNTIEDLYKGNFVGNMAIITDTNEPRTTGELMDRGWNLIGAQKQGLIDDIRKLKDYEIIVCGESEEIERELNNYIWNDKKAGIPIDDFNHCFTGDTLVTTLSGDKSIRNIRKGHKILTSSGYHDCLKVWNNGIKKINLYWMQFDTFSLFLTCTDSHKIKTNRGWVEISSLKKNETLYLHKSFNGRCTDYTQAKGITPKVVKDFIEWFGSFITDQFLKATMYITLMMIKAITIFQTLTLLVHACTGGLQTQRGLGIIQKLSKSLQRLAVRRLKDGMHLKRVRSGIPNTESRFIKTEDRLKRLAKFVETPTSPSGPKGQDFVTKTVGLKRCVNVASWNEEVYDLTVDEQHEYFANGVLVHNCLDGMRYGVKFLSGGVITTHWH